MAPTLSLSSSQGLCAHDGWYLQWDAATWGEEDDVQSQSVECQLSHFPVLKVQENVMTDNEGKRLGDWRAIHFDSKRIWWSFLTFDLVGFIKSTPFAKNQMKLISIATLVVKGHGLKNIFWHHLCILSFNRFWQEKLLTLLFELDWNGNAERLCSFQIINALAKKLIVLQPKNGSKPWKATRFVCRKPQLVHRRTETPTKVLQVWCHWRCSHHDSFGYEKVAKVISVDHDFFFLFTIDDHLFRFGFITFADSASLEAVLNGPNAESLDGKVLQCHIATRRKGSSQDKVSDGGLASCSPSKRKVFVGGLSQETSNEDLRRHFAGTCRFGEASVLLNSVSKAFGPIETVNIHFYFNLATLYLLDFGSTCLQCTYRWQNQTHDGLIQRAFEIEFSRDGVSLDLPIPSM